VDGRGSGAGAGRAQCEAARAEQTNWVRVARLERGSASGARDTRLPDGWPYASWTARSANFDDAPIELDFNRPRSWRVEI